MSAANLIIQDDAIHLLTDGAAYDITGNLLYTSPKVWPLLKQNAMFTVRGPAMLGPIFATTLVVFDTFDEIRDGFVDAIQTTLESCQFKLDAIAAGADMEIIVAGWSETEGAYAFDVVDHDRNPILKPWTPTRIGPVSLSPGSPEVHQEFLNICGDRYSPNDLDPEHDGMRILEMQRRFGFNALNVQNLCLVGGLAQLATVHRDGRFESRILHRWPDRIGERIAA